MHSRQFFIEELITPPTWHLAPKADDRLYFSDTWPPKKFQSLSLRGTQDLAHAPHRQLPLRDDAEARANSLTIGERRILPKSV